jgi:hypothetical protein
VFDSYGVRHQAVKIEEAEILGKLRMDDAVAAIDCSFERTIEPSPGQLLPTLAQFGGFAGLEKLSSLSFVVLALSSRGW